MHPAHVAREIALAFAERCGSSSYDPVFLRHKRRCEAEPVDFSSSEQLNYNRPISIVEFFELYFSTQDDLPKTYPYTGFVSPALDIG